MKYVVSGSIIFWITIISILATSCSVEEVGMLGDCDYNGADPYHTDQVCYTNNNNYKNANPKISESETA